jgi:glutaredoxin
MRIRRWLLVIILLLSLGSLSLLTAPARAAEFDPSLWVTTNTEGEPRVRLQVFWSRTCPHCRSALAFIETLRQHEPWIEIQTFELTQDRTNLQRYVEQARTLGEEAQAVPAFFVCGRMLTGFDNAEGMGAQLLGLAHFCRRLGPSPVAGSGQGGSTFSAEAATLENATAIDLPLLGRVDANQLSLPALTLVLASLDAFNPCAFFVLLFLLSLMVHARGRGRMLLVGVTFVVFSGLVYFLFMAAWLNLFLVVGGAAVVTTVAGLIALLIGGLNIKDYFLFKQGPTLSIPDQAKPGLFARMRGLIAADRLGTLLLGTATLALAANSYELLCTAGFPMVFTRTLTLQQLPASTYYGYLALYNLIYVLPLLAIVLAFTFTLGARKLSERQGRVLKLLSGVMMLSLGLVMLLAPDLLSRHWVGIALLSVALLATWLIARLTRPVRTSA